MKSLTSTGDVDKMKMDEDEMVSSVNITKFGHCMCLALDFVFV